MNTILYFQSKSKINAEEKLSGVKEIAAKSHWLTQIVDGLPSKKTIRSLVGFWKPFGVIVECGGTSTTVDSDILRDIPVVFFDHDPSCLPRNALCVTHDSKATGEMAAKELMLGGASTFAYVPFPEMRFWSKERERGFVRSLALNGHPCSIFDGKPSSKDPTHYQRKLREFLSALPKPCALFAANDETANEVLVAAAHSDIKVPDELSVIGVDNASGICEHTSPTLTSVKPDFHHGGMLAALMLMTYEKLRRGPMEARRQTFGPLEVVRRVSTRTFLKQDPEVINALDLIRREACSGLTAVKALGLFKTSRRMAERRFFAATGRTILEEIHAVRLERAKQLIEAGSIPLKSISDFCGFKNPNSLRKFFLKSTGMTMSAWRRQADLYRNELSSDVT